MTIYINVVLFVICTETMQKVSTTTSCGCSLIKRHQILFNLEIVIKWRPFGAIEPNVCFTRLSVYYNVSHEME